MIDTQKALRKAYYDTLNGFLSVTVEDTPFNVPVYDEVARDNTFNYYVLMTTQTATEDSTLTRFAHETTMLLDIVAKTGTKVTKDKVDDIASQIMALVLPSVGTNGLVSQPYLQIALVKKESDNYFPVQTTATGLVIRRLLRFSQFIHEL